MVKDLKDEEWKNVIGYEGMYMVSNLGRVKSLERVDFRGNHLKEKLLIPGRRNGRNSCKNDYYLAVYLYKNAKRKAVSIHRLVASHFIPNPNNYTVVNHIDENKQNNKASNLEWTTVADNNRFGTSQQRRAQTIKNNKSKMCGFKIGVVQLDLNGNVICEFKSISEAHRKTGCSRDNITACLKGWKESSRGFRWKYTTD